MVHGGGHDDRVVARLVKRTFHLGTAAATVLTGSLILGVLCHRGLEGISRNLHLAGDFFKGLTLKNHARALDVAFDGLEALTDGFIKEEVGVAGGLLQNGGRDLVTGAQFVVEALAVHVDEHSTVTADSFRDHDAGLFVKGRVGLNFRQIHEGCADLFGQKQAVARGTRMVRGGKALQTRNDLGNEGIVGTEAAVGVHHGLGVNRVDLAVFKVLHLDADHCTLLVLDEVDNLAFGSQIDLTGLNSVIESLHDFGADSCATRGTVAALVGSAAHEAHVVEVTAELNQPLHSGVGILSENLDEFGVVLVVTTLHRVLVHLFDAVLDAELGLLRGFSRIDAARGADRVAADKRHLFKNDHLGSKIVRRNGSRHTGTARTDHDDVGVLSSLSRTEGCGKHGSNYEFLHYVPLLIGNCDGPDTSLRVPHGRIFFIISACIGTTPWVSPLCCTKCHADFQKILMRINLCGTIYRQDASMSLPVWPWPPLRPRYWRAG